MPKGTRPAPDAERRTVAQLLAARDVLVKEKNRKAAERAAREQTRREGEQAETRASTSTAWPAASRLRGARSKS